MAEKDGKLGYSELLKIARENFPKLLASTCGLDNYFMVYEDGTISGIHTGQACYAQFSNIFVKDKKRPYFFVTWHRTTKELDQDGLDYFDWLFNESPYARIFVTKRPSRVWKEPVVIRAKYSPA